MNYKKSILSLVTILAFNNSVWADPNATYVPLTNKSYDNAWVMFGVNGFGDGTSSAPSASGVFTAGYSTVTEADATDDLASPSLTIITAAVAGTIFNDSGTKNMATFQALKDPAGTAYYSVPVTMGLKTSDLTFSETQPVRSMYIAIQTSTTDTNTIAKIKLDYKAVLEGRNVEIQLNNTGTLYTAVINQAATFNAPAIAKYVAPASGATPLTTPAETLAYDLSAAPVVASSYDKTKHQGTATGGERFYHYDEANAVWTLWDRAKVVAGSNTLLNFEKGKSYWGRININSSTAGDTNTTSSTVAGLYLGKSGLAEADPAVYTGKLTTGAWNMLAFDPTTQRQDIRNSTTGIVVTMNALVSGDMLTVLDETGVNSVDVNFTTAGNFNSAARVAKRINEVIEASKLLGKVPKAFSVKAFGSTSGITPVIFISDKKFTLKDTAGDIIAGAKTLANNNVVNTETGLVMNVTDVNTTGATSVYGEYTLLIEPLTGTNTASNIDSTLAGGGGGISAKVQFGDINGASLNGATTATPLALAVNNTASTLAGSAAILVTDDVFDGTKATGRMVEIDTNFNDTSDMLLMASDKPFYIKDQTFTRIYNIDSTTANGTTVTNTNVAYTIKNTASTTLLPATNDAVANFVTAINAQADKNGTTLTYAWADAAKLVVMTTDSPLMDLLDADSASLDYFTQTTSTADVSKGAIKQVIDVSKLARQDVTLNKVTISFTADALSTEAEDNLTITTVVDGTTIIPAGYAIPLATRTDTTIITMLDALVSNLNAALKTSGLAAFASHDYVNGYNDITKAIITLQGVDINNTLFSETNATAVAATVAETATSPGAIVIASADIIADLKSNPIYTPDYVNYGPLYTLKDAGYQARAILRASTNIASTPTTHWDAIDLTRASSDWLKNNEFNLFSIDNASGYWVYIDSYTNPNNVSSSNVVLTPSFAYHFNPITNTTNNIVNTSSFSVDIANSNAATSNAKLVISGSEIQLVNTGSTYTANINEYEAGLTSGAANTFSIKVADGLGERYDNTNLVTLDYVKPATPTVVFNTPINATFADTSVDLANYYLWANYIPDNGASATGPISPASALSYNMCTATTFASSTPYKLVGVDGVGTFGNANISDAKAFTFTNAEKDATVLTHSYGNSASTAMRYDASCLSTANTTKSGVEVRAQGVGTIKLAYQHITGSINSTNDIPITSYYDIAASGTAVIQVDSLATYSGNTFYVQYNNALYTGTFPASRSAADASFSTPLNLTAVSSENQKLD